MGAGREARPGAACDLPGLRPRHRAGPGRLGRHRPRPAARPPARSRSPSSLFAVEVGGTIWIETHYPSTPWHPHHIAERYGLLAIITFGEVILGTTTAIEAVVAEQGWSAEAAVIALAGVSLAVGLWWCYFTVPYGEALRGSDASSMVFGFGHMLLYAAIAATGAGLHAAAYLLEHHSELDTAQTVLTMAVPVGLFVVVLLVLFHVMFPGRDPLHYWLLAGTLVVLVAAWLLAARRRVDDRVARRADARAVGHRRRLRAARAPPRPEVRRRRGDAASGRVATVVSRRVSRRGSR